MEGKMKRFTDRKKFKMGDPFGSVQKFEIKEKLYRHFRMVGPVLLFSMMWLKTKKSQKTFPLYCPSFDPIEEKYSIMNKDGSFLCPACDLNNISRRKGNKNVVKHQVIMACNVIDRELQRYGKDYIRALIVSNVAVGEKIANKMEFVRQQLILNPKSDSDIIVDPADVKMGWDFALLKDLNASMPADKYVIEGVKQNALTDEELAHCYGLFQVNNYQYNGYALYEQGYTLTQLYNGEIQGLQNIISPPHLYDLDMLYIPTVPSEIQNALEMNGYYDEDQNVEDTSINVDENDDLPPPPIMTSSKSNQNAPQVALGVPQCNIPQIQTQQIPPPPNPLNISQNPLIPNSTLYAPSIPIPTSMSNPFPIGNNIPSIPLPSNPVQPQGNILPSIKPLPTPPVSVSPSIPPPPPPPKTRGRHKKENTPVPQMTNSFPIGESPKEVSSEGGKCKITGLPYEQATFAGNADCFGGCPYLAECSQKAGDAEDTEDN